MKDMKQHKKYILIFCLFLQNICRTFSDVSIPKISVDRGGLLKVGDSFIEGWTSFSVVEDNLAPLLSRLFVNSKTGEIFIDKASYCELFDRYNHLPVHSFLSTESNHKIGLVRDVPLYKHEGLENCKESSEEKIETNNIVTLIVPDNEIAESVSVDLRSLLSVRSNNKAKFSLKFQQCTGRNDSKTGFVLHVNKNLQETAEKCSSRNENFLYVAAEIKGEIVEEIGLKVLFQKDYERRLLAAKRKRRDIQYPVFQRRVYRIPVREDTSTGSKITTIQVVPNSVPGLTITYSISPSNIGFSIDQKTGAITLTSKLDFETKEYYTLWIRTSFDSARLIVNVIDVNDNSPVFEQNPYTRTVKEDVMSTASILEVKATDKDSGLNGDVKYSLVNPGGVNLAFDIDEYTGQIFLPNTRLDREKASKYELIVKAEDQGTPKRSSQTKVIITISDVNDNSPVFEKTEYTYTMSEKTPIGTKLFRVKATDDDEGTNSKLSYVIFNDYSNPVVSKFDMNRLTGDISLKQKLDYENEQERSIRFTVEATDAGIPPKKGSTFVTITVNDDNDNAPIFRSHCVEYVFESAAKGDTVCTVSASDRDASAPNNEVVYTLDNPPADLPFMVDHDTGQVKVSAPLDYDNPKTRKFEFAIKASDKGNPSKSANTIARITLKNVNDNYPVFSKSNYKVSIPETTRPGRSILELSATDIDQPDSTEFQYSIAKGNEKNCFSITDNKIYVQCNLNYDTDKVYNLTVEVKDSGALGKQFSTQTYAVIKIIDANTHAPLFGQTTYVPSVREDAPIGTLIFNVSATDLDSGENGRISYSLVNSDGYFKINSVTGEVRTVKKLDSEKNRKHELRVMAQDHGKPIKSSVHLWTVTVIDVNDNAPIFQRPVYRMGIKEDVDIGKLLLRVRAFDADSDFNNKAIIYSMSEDYNGNGTFYIKTEGRYGTVRNSKKLDREKIDKYELIIYATDKGTPPLNSSAKIEFTVEDVMDSPPVFEKKSYNATLDENYPSGKTFLKVRATTADLHRDAEISYLINPGGSVFTIDGFTGEISIRQGRTLDYETKREYRFGVTAYYGNVGSDSTTVTVKVNDLNDNHPILKPFNVFVNFYQDHFPKNATIKIPAYDKDVKDVLTYEIFGGDGRKYVSLNRKTGNLTFNSNIENVGSEVGIDVRVSDGLHKTEGRGSITATRISSEMIQNLVRIVLNDLTEETFLSSSNIKLFRSAFADAVGCNRRLVFIVGVKNYRSFLVPDKTPKVQISVTAREKTGGPFFTPKRMKDSLYMNKVQFMKAMGKKVISFDDGDELWCSRESCLNYQKCEMKVEYQSITGKNANPKVTETMVFWGIKPRTTLSCTCPQGFRNLISKGKMHICGRSYSLCYSNPCKSNGVCVSTGQGYACKCKPGYAGKNCDINMNLQTCPSNSAGICQNNGYCASDLVNNGLKCVCTVPRAEYTRRCQLTTRSFAAGSYLSFSGLTNRWKLSLSLEFATESANAILFYNGRYSEQRDFIAIRINGGQVELVFSLGENPVIVRSYIPGGVSNGDWQKVSIGFENKIGSIAVGKDCDIEMATLANPDTKKKYCAASKAFVGDSKSLDLSAPFHIGGHPNLGFSMRIPNWDFIGCIRNVFIDHLLLDLEKPLQQNLTTPGCPVKKDFCAGSPCGNGACVNVLSGFRCDCKDGYVGKRCEIDVKTNSPAVRFETGAIMTFKNLAYTLKAPTTSVTAEMSVKTRQTDSVLIHQQIDGKNAYLKIVSGSLKYFYEAKEMANLSSAFLSDGKWHHVKVRLDSKSIQLSQDYERHHVTRNHLLNIDTKPVKFFSVGAVKQGQAVTQSFLGCLQGFLTNGVYQTLQGPNIRAGCQSKAQCGACGTGSCSNGWDNDVCECTNGFTGPNCIDVCSLKPCLNEGQCRRSTTAIHGFVCSCKPSFTGLRCETKMSTDCEDGYYGLPGKGLCGPCNCDISKSFDPKCNKTSGMCFCKAGYYLVGEVCQPCNCLPEGTINSECDRMTGQCRCKPRAIGINCDRCIGPFEAIKNKCKEINTSCPESFSENIWWRSVKLGETKVENCPRGTTGNATRYCHPKRGWQKAQMNLCTTNEFNFARKTLKKIGDKKLKMTKKLATELATSLEYALSTGKTLYENDIRIGYNAISKIVEYETNQTEYNLISSSDGKFVKNIVMSTSRLLETDSRDIWKSIQKVDSGTVSLMEKMEKLLTIMTENFSYVKRRARRSVTTLPPYGFASKNMLMEFQQLNIKDASSYRFPLEHSAWTKDQSYWKNTKNKIKIPSGVFNNTDVRSSETTVGLLLYRTLGDLLPSVYQEESTKKTYNVDLYSDVLTLTVPGLNNRTLNDNITITFKNKKNNASAGLDCVSWNYSSQSTKWGGWSKTGCALVPDNGSLITCQCNHLTSFAAVKFVEVLPPVMGAYTVPALTYVTVSISMALLFLTLLTYICLSQLRSNANSIHKNLCAALLFAELIFVVGINRTANGTVCRIIAILLHYFFSCVFSWMLVEAFHLYRMIVEKRNINYEQMRFYYFIGWGAPVIVVGVTIGLSPEGYGNERFCWISTQGQLLWTFTAPIMAMVAANLLLFVMASFASCKRQTSVKEAKNISRLRFNMVVSAVLLPVLCATFVIGLVSVNIELSKFSVLFSGFIMVPAVYIVLFHVLFNKEVRDELKNAYIRWKTGDPAYGKKKPRVKRTLLVDSSYRSQLAQLTTTFNLSTTTTDSSTDGGRVFAKRRRDDRSDLPSSTQPDSSDTSDEETNNPDTNLSDSSDSSDEDDMQVPSPPNMKTKSHTQSAMSPNSSRSSNSAQPNGARSPPGGKSSSGATSPPMNGSRTPDWKVANQKKLRTAPLYASDGPMHSTPSDNSDNSEKRLKKKWPHPDEPNPALDLTDVTVISEEKDGPEDPLLSSLRRQRTDHGSSSDSSEVSSLPSVIRVGPGGKPQSILKKTSKYGSATDSDSERRGKVRVRITDKQKRPLLKLDRENPEFQDSQV